MGWTPRDINLFTIVNQSGKYHLEAQIQQASDKFFTLKERPKYFIIFGFYNLAKNVFVWLNEINKLSSEIVKKEHMDIFETDTTLKKLFQNEVTLDKQYMNVIPYLMEALNKHLNVVCIKNDTHHIYALTSIDGIKKTFNLTIFEEALYYYRNYNEINKLSKKEMIKNKEPKNSVVECKENLV